jgi:mono/diheme cytochrome c family protein
MPRLTNPTDHKAPVNDRVKAYLATNCSHCHIPEGGGNSKMDLTPWVAADKQHLLNAIPQHGSLGLADARLIRPGDASASVLPVRMMARGPGQMPPLGSLHSDPEGIQLLIQWLLTLER